MAAPSKLEPPRDLTIPESGSTTARDVLSRSIGRLMGELRAIVRDPAALPLPRADAEALRELVTATLTERPAPSRARFDDPRRACCSGRCGTS